MNAMIISTVDYSVLAAIIRAHLLLKSMTVKC